MVLKNHGLLTAAKSISAAVILADTMEKEAEIQLLAMAASNLSPPSESGNKRTKAYLFNDEMFNRGWTYLLRKLAAENPEIFKM